MVRSLFAAGAIALVAGSASATVYTDSAGDLGVGGQAILDILSVEVTNDATSISFKFTLAGDVVATDWGKYCVMIDSRAGGDTVGDGWARPIGMVSGGDTWLGGWADGGNGLENRQSDFGGAWSLAGATYQGTPGLSISKTQFTVTETVLLADIGLSGGGSIFFDCYTTGGGGGDTAIDALANPDPSVFDWGEYYNSGGTGPAGLKYLVSVPAPGTAGLAGLAGIVALRRRR